MHSRSLVVPGLVGAAAAVVCVGIGWQLGRGTDPSAATFTLPATAVEATATQAHDNFVIATGFVDEGLEALYFLDFMTGELKAVVINERGGGFAAMYRRNIMQDFGPQTVANAKYLMVTGRANNLQRVGAKGRIGENVLYVVEATSGKIVAYGIPWTPTLAAAGKPQRGTFLPLAMGTLRTEVVRDQ